MAIFTRCYKGQFDSQNSLNQTKFANFSEISILLILITWLPWQHILTQPQYLTIKYEKDPIYHIQLKIWCWKIDITPIDLIVAKNVFSWNGISHTGYLPSLVTMVTMTVTIHSSIHFMRLSPTVVSTVKIKSIGFIYWVLQGAIWLPKFINQAKFANFSEISILLILILFTWLPWQHILTSPQYLTMKYKEDLLHHMQLRNWCWVLSLQYSDLNAIRGNSTPTIHKSDQTCPFSWHFDTIDIDHLVTMATYIDTTSVSNHKV